MKFTHIAAAAVIPAAIAGAAIAVGSGSQAGPPSAQNTAARTTAAQTTAARVSSARSKAPGSHSATNVWVVVRPGDTLSGIAAAHHMTWQAIYATPPNNRVLHNPNLLLAGERLRIPANPRLRAAQFAAEYAAGLSQQASAASGPAGAQPFAAAQPAAAPQSAAGGASLTAGESSFEQCVALRESSDTPTDPDGLFGMLPSTWQSLGYSGTAGQASVAVQKAAFSKLYAEDGTSPWAPYDGC